MTPRIVSTTAGAAPRRLPWDARSPHAAPSPNAAPDRFQDALQLAREDATALAAALAEEDRITAEMIRRRIKELETGSARVAGKRKVSLRMPPPGPTESFARIMTAWEAPEEAPRKKRRLAFPPPTAHETRCVA